LSKKLFFESLVVEGYTLLKTALEKDEKIAKKKFQST
jgi:hypothetical protein